jgi:hypothetical protein
MSGSTKSYVDKKIQARRIMMFAKSNDPDSIKAKKILEQYFLPTGKLNKTKKENLFLF